MAGPNATLQALRSKERASNAFGGGIAWDYADEKNHWPPLSDPTEKVKISMF